MNRFDNTLVAASALVLLAVPAHAARAKLDAPAPDFNVVTVTKDKIDLTSLHGQVVVINRWATWCGPCRAEFVLFDGYAALRAKYGLTIIAIETGGAGASGPMRDLAKAVHFPVVLADHAHAAAYPIIDNGVPTNYVIDRAGVVRYAKTGAFEIDELDALIRPLLSERVLPEQAPIAK